jgi:GGDEF domain-containing protein
MTQRPTSQGPDPFVLRARVVLLVLCTIGALTVFMGFQSSRGLTRAYHEAGRSELRAIASTWDDGFRLVDVREPERLQRRMARVKRNNPNLHKIGMSWRDREGRRWLVAIGHEHGPDGAKRDVTSRADRYLLAPGRFAPIDQPASGYREAREGAAHYLELVHPVERPGRGVVAALEVHYDLKRLDQAKAREQDQLLLTGVAVATALALLLNFILRRTVVNPLQGLALRDPLTGLLNHRAFQERLGEELRRAERERYAVSVVAMDIDDFKGINDGLGHVVGDEALRRLAGVIRAEVRPSDVCGRLGGDEFAVALVRTDAEEAQRVVERIRTRWPAPTRSRARAR